MICTAFVEPPLKGAGIECRV